MTPLALLATRQPLCIETNVLNVAPSWKVLAREGVKFVEIRLPSEEKSPLNNWVYGLSESYSAQICNPYPDL